jgi:hypothetical protein
MASAVENIDGTVSRAAAGRMPSVVNNYGNRSDNMTARQSVAMRNSRLEMRRSQLAGVADANPGDKRNFRNSAVQIDDGRNVTFKDRDIFENYTIKPANKIFRWNLLWCVILVISPYPLWLPWLGLQGCKLNAVISTWIALIFTLNFMYTTVLCWRYMWKMLRSFNTPYWQECDPVLREKVMHIVVMPTYKEPLELLLDTVSSVANQSIAQQIVMTVGMEEGTPDQEEKKRAMRQRFGDVFKAMVFTVHPKGIPGEITGACSNRNYAARGAVKFCIKNRLLDVDPVTKSVDLDFSVLTVCDADTTFHYRYYENLTWCFLNEPPESRYQVCWQSPLFYNIALDQRWFFTRAMGILRAYFMVGFLIGYSINTMSIYSVSLSLLVEGRFFHSGYQMDDIIYTLSAMRAIGKRVFIRTIDIPTLSGPTSGETLWSEWEEWVVQATRWTIGAAEVFHYFFVKLIHRNYLWPGIVYFFVFVYYYGFILCLGGIVGLCNFIMFLVSLGIPQIRVEYCRPFQEILGLPDDSSFYLWTVWGFWLFDYVVVYGTAYCMDAIASQILAIDEHVNPIRNIMHWLSTRFCLFAYCMVEYKGIIEIAWQGKAVCGHKASDKSNLVKS